MAVEDLTQHDKRIIGACLNALVDGPFIPDWEFQTVCGFDRHEMAQIAATWPENESSDISKRVVNAAMNNLIGYPHNKYEELSKRVAASYEEIANVYQKWLRLNR